MVFLWFSYGLVPSRQGEIRGGNRINTVDSRNPSQITPVDSEIPSMFHGKTMGKPIGNGGLMGFSMRFSMGYTGYLLRSHGIDGPNRNRWFT